MALTLHGTVADNTVVLSRQNTKPLIINGDMAVAQRGTSLATDESEGYIIDRFAVGSFNGNTITFTQDSDVPSGQGFTKSMKATNTTGTAASVFEFICQRMEGLDTAQLDFGTSSAKQITLSFFVKSSVTGTYNVALRNNANDRGYVADYTISSANTWEKKVITIPGDTTGTWLTTNGIGIRTWFILGAGASSQTSPNAWGTSGDSGSSNLTNAFTTTGSATFFLTGVQMEVGNFDANSIAPFQHESFADNLLRCQRYCQVYGPHGNTMIGVGMTQNTSNVYRWDFTNMKTSMRAAPSGAISGTVNCWNGGTGANAVLGTSYNTTELVGYDLSCDAGLTNTTGIVAKIFLNTGTFTLTAEL
tara:strand:- start:158 stop:1240 length:1083 start_codon:yes stop_codon:yes gene_type:complete